MSPEIMVICQIIQSRDIDAARKEGLQPGHFGSPRERAAYAFLLQYAEDHKGDVPTRDIFHARSGYQDWVIVPENISVKSLAEEVVRLSLAREIEQALPDPIELRKRPKELGRALLERVRASLVGHGDRSQHSFRTSAPSLLSRIAAGGPLHTGLPFPWPTLTEASMGLIPEEVSIIYGRPGTYKTWMLLSVMVHLMIMKPGLTILFCSCELPVDMIVRRAASLLAKINYSKIRSGRMDDEEKFRLEGTLFTMTYEPSTYADVHMTTPDDLAPVDIERKIELVRPDLVLMDSAYLQMEPDLDPMNHRSLSQTILFLKRMSREHQIPVVASFHAGRKKSEQVGRGGGDDLYGSDVVSQRADVLYRTYVSPGDDGKDRLLIHIAKSREFNLAGLLIKIPPAEGTYDEIGGLHTASAVETLLMKLAKGPSLTRATSLSTAAIAAYSKDAERPEGDADE